MPRCAQLLIKPTSCRILLKSANSLRWQKLTKFRVWVPAWDRPLLRWENLPWIIWWAHPFYAQWFLHSVMTSFLHFSSFQWKPISIRAQFSNSILERPFKRICSFNENIYNLDKAIWCPSSNQHYYFRKKSSSLRWQRQKICGSFFLLLCSFALKSSNKNGTNISHYRAHYKLALMQNSPKTCT